MDKQIMYDKFVPGRLNGEQFEIGFEIAENLMVVNGLCGRLDDRTAKIVKSKRFANMFVKLSVICHKFFHENPHLLTDDLIDMLCDGFEDEIQLTFGNFDGYNDVDNIINKFLDMF